MLRIVATIARFLTLLVLLTVTAYSSETSQWWQMVFNYENSTLSLAQVAPIQPTAKRIITPGLESAPIRLSYSAEWRNQAGDVVAEGTVEIPVGMRAAFVEGQPCQVVIPEEGMIVVRAQGPLESLAPVSLTLSSSAAPQMNQPDLEIPPAFQFQQKTFAIDIRQPRPMQGPVSVTKLRDTGPDQNRLTMVVLGDGYTAATLSTGIFTTHTNALMTAFNATPPWNDMFLGSNVYRINVESNEDGADQDPQGTFRDTYFNSSFWVNGIERLLAINQTGYDRAVAAADAMVGVGMWDQLIVLVNSTKYGGSGGAIVVLSAHSSGPQVILHELGHTYADLADEYTSAYPGFPPGDPEANVDYDASGPGLKWLPWVEAGTPLPTPDISTWYNAVGAFEGARYLTTGIYRPSHNCLMRALGVALDPVCKEAHLRTYFDRTSLIDAASPVVGGSSKVTFGGIDFTVNPIPFPGLQYQWKINSTILPETDSTLNLTWREWHDLGVAPGSDLVLTISYPTSLMRLSTVASQYAWDLQPDCNGNGITDATDIASHFSADANFNGVPDECDQMICCEGTTGNVNLSGGVDISDLSILISYLTVMPRPGLACEAEANVNAADGIDLSDLSVLISYLVTTPQSALPNCP